MKNVPAKKESVYEQAKSYILIGLMKNSPAIAGTSAMEIHRQWKFVLPGGLQWKILISLVSLVLAVFWQFFNEFSLVSLVLAVFCEAYVFCCSPRFRMIRNANCFCIVYNGEKKILL